MKLTAELRRLAARAGFAPGAGEPETSVAFGVESIFVHASKVKVQVPLKSCGSYVHAGFGPHDGNPLRDAAEIYSTSGDRTRTRAFLAEFYAVFQPQTLAESLFRESNSGLTPLSELSPFDNFQPWRPDIGKMRGRNGEGNQSFGPVSEGQLATEVHKIVSYTDSIRANGYKPHLYRRGPIMGYFLLHSAEHRFMITNGMHRTAVLAALGHEVIEAEFDPRRPRVVDSRQMDIWPMVSSGFCSRALAERYVMRYFQPAIR